MSIVTGFGALFSGNFSLASLWNGVPWASSSAMNSERCANLHNQIVEIGWEGSGRRLEDLERKSWFEQYGDDANAVRSSLSAELILFLERAWVPDAGRHSFFYYVWGLQHPKALYQNHETHNSGSGFNRYLTLYDAHNMVSHHDGLV